VSAEHEDGGWDRNRGYPRGRGRGRGRGFRGRGRGGFNGPHADTQQDGGHNYEGPPQGRGGYNYEAPPQGRGGYNYEAPPQGRDGYNYEAPPHGRGIVSPLFFILHFMIRAAILDFILYYKKNPRLIF